MDALNELKAGVTGDGALCGISSTTTKIDAKAFDTSLPRIREITDIVSAAVTKADEIGAQVIGRASEAISTPTGSSDVRDVESPMSNMVAQMFREVLGGDRRPDVDLQVRSFGDHRPPAGEHHRGRFVVHPGPDEA